MNDILVHIGYHKTGTTWIQNELFNFESELFIPLSKNRVNQSTLAKNFFYNKEGYLLNSFDDNEEVIQACFNEILADKSIDENKVLVMSHERLSGNPHSSGFDSSIIARRIKNVFPKAKVLIIIREQSSWLLSNYFQYLSIGGTHSLKKYLNLKYDGKRPGFSPVHIEYHHLIQEYLEKFGKQNVLVLPYELLTFNKKLFIGKIEAFIGKKIPIDDIDFGRRYNKKKNQFIAYKLRSLNRFIYSSSVNNNTGLTSKYSIVFVQKFTSLLDKFLPNSINESFKQKLAKEIEVWPHNRFENSNRIIQESIDINLEKYGYKTRAVAALDKAE